MGGSEGSYTFKLTAKDKRAKMNSNIEETKKRLLYWMIDFILDDDDPSYTKEDVAECDSIITNFISEVDNSSKKSDYSWVVSKVKTLVLLLNAFNEKHDYTIIETDQREDICALIALVIENAGHKINHDITEEWREW